MADEAPLHVLDLPRPSSKPPAETLLTLLDHLKLKPVDFSGRSSPTSTFQIQGNVTPWLTTLISSPLLWLPSAAREAIWDSASARLAERAGSMGQSSLQREIRIPTGYESDTPVASAADGPSDVLITLNEPAVTNDNLGTKTWGSAYLLAAALSELAVHIPGLVLRSAVRAVGGSAVTIPRMRVLELGAGTGLVGLAASAVWWVDVDMTDLEGPVLENLQTNIETNAPSLESVHGPSNLRSFHLDWSTTDPSTIHPADSSTSASASSYPLILAADSIYSPEHPSWLANTVAAHLAKFPDARFIVELPVRKGYEKERRDLDGCLRERGLVEVVAGVHWGFDEHGDRGEKREHTWAVWGWGAGV